MAKKASNPGPGYQAKPSSPPGPPPIGGSGVQRWTPPELDSLHTPDAALSELLVSEDDRALWLDIRQGLLVALGGIERYLGLPRTKEPKAK